MITTIPNEQKSFYPFSSHFFENEEGHRIHYLDEGKGPVIVLLHGNPTWSWFYRNWVKELSTSFRIIVPDHLGCGLSDKPQSHRYQLIDHIDNLSQLLTKLGIHDFSLGVHDWGGAIGFGLAVLEKEKFKVNRILALNTAAYTCDYIPWQINLCKTPGLGAKMIRHFNLFAWPATFMAVTKPMKKAVKKGYLLPYHNYRSRIATTKFVEDIPMNQSHPSYQTLKKIEDGLKELTCPKLFLWGKKDFCFNDYFLNRWKDIYSDSKFVEFQEAGHYVLEDEPEQTARLARKFYSGSLQ